MNGPATEQLARKPCEYCGADLPAGVDKDTRRVRSAHFAEHAEERASAEAVQGCAPGRGKPDWPHDLVSFAERAAYQRGVADERRWARKETLALLRGAHGGQQTLVGELLWVLEDVWPLVHGLNSRASVQERFRRLPALLEAATQAPKLGLPESCFDKAAFAAAEQAGEQALPAPAEGDEQALPEPECYLHHYRKIGGGARYTQPNHGGPNSYPDPNEGYEWVRSEPLFTRADLAATPAAPEATNPFAPLRVVVERDGGQELAVVGRYEVDGRDTVFVATPPAPEAQQSEDWKAIARVQSAKRAVALGEPGAADQLREVMGSPDWKCAQQPAPEADDQPDPLPGPGLEVGDSGFDEWLAEGGERRKAPR